MCNSVTYTTGSHYGTVTTIDISDPCFTIDMSDVTLNGKIFPIKYRLLSGLGLANSFLYPKTTTGGQGEREAGVLSTDKMTSSGESQLVINSIESYANNVQNGELLLADLVKAKMMYLDSAYNYVN